MNKFLIPQGFRDLNQIETKKKRYFSNFLIDLYENYGYEEISVPLMEKLNYETSQKVASYFSLTDTTGDTLFLRDEMTRGVLRYVESHGDKDCNDVLRLSYCGEVYRQESLQEGKNRSVTQIGVEQLGVNNYKSDCEVLLMALDSLVHGGVKGYSLVLSHMVVLKEIISLVSESKDVEEEIKNLLIKKDIVKLRSVLDSLDCPGELKDNVLYIALNNGSLDFLQKVSGFSTTKEFKEAIALIYKIYEVLTVMGYGEKIVFDFTVLGDFSYYTGIIFECYGGEIPHPIIKGGRYDNYMTKNQKWNTAIGFALNLETYTKGANFVDVKKKISEESNDFLSCRLARSLGNISITDLRMED